MNRFNLRSSSALNYCFGHYTPRAEMIEWDRKGEQKPIGDFMQKYVDFGNLHEKSGIAKWILINKQMPTEILSEQKNYVVENFLNLKGDTLVDLSCTPDGRFEDTLIEVKCGSLGKNPHEWEKAKVYLAQISLQQYVLNSLGIEINRTHLLSWSNNGTRVWEISRNTVFEHYLLELLEEYAICLLGKGDVDKKPKKFEGEHKIKLIYGEE